MANEAWIAVDFDGTMAYHGGRTVGGLGEPIAPMIERVRKWIADGITVKVFTARANPSYQFAERDISLIRKWCLKHVGCQLPVTCMKDFNMMVLYDDRARQVEENTGRLIEMMSPLILEPAKIILNGRSPK